VASLLGSGHGASARGVSEAVLAALPHFGLSSICNVLAAIKTAKTLDLGAHDVIVTVATDGAAMYGSEIPKAKVKHFGGTFGAAQAVEAFERLNESMTDAGKPVFANPPLLGDNPVDDFLFTTRRGFCEHFAAAFVTLMRAAGIPSRVVVGYLGGELNTAGNYLIVRQSDAHAWAEIWTAERGWVRADPTGAVAPERIELGLEAVRRLEQQGIGLGSLPADAVLRAMELGWFEYVARHARWYWDLTNMTWYRWVVDYGKERQERFLASLGLDDISWSRLTGLLFAGALLVTLVYAFFLLRPKKSVDPALALYLRFCRQLACAGMVRAPHEGAVDFAQRCAHRRPDLKNRMEAITERYVRVRYGQLTGADELRTLKHEVTVFRA